MRKCRRLKSSKFDQLELKESTVKLLTFYTKITFELKNLSNCRKSHFTNVQSKRLTVFLTVIRFGSAPCVKMPIYFCLQHASSIRFHHSREYGKFMSPINVRVFYSTTNLWHKFYSHRKFLKSVFLGITCFLI